MINCYVYLFCQCVFTPYLQFFVSSCVCFCFHYTFRPPVRLALISVVVCCCCLLYFTKLVYLFDVSSLRVVVSVCAHCLLSLFVCFCLFHKGKIILSVNMSVCGCMCVRLCYDHNNCVCLLFRQYLLRNMREYRYFFVFVYEMYLNRDEWDCLRARALSLSREKMSAQKSERDRLMIFFVCL